MRRAGTAGAKARGKGHAEAVLYKAKCRVEVKTTREGKDNVTAAWIG
jgi:hypothetical protein